MQKWKNCLLTFGKTGQESNIYIFCAFGKVFFFAGKEVLLEAVGVQEKCQALLQHS